MLQWNWDEEKTGRWLEMAVEMPYLAQRWSGEGFRDLLDNGCGPGRHAIYFARQGFAVTGFDQSRQALDYLTAWAAREEVPVNIREGDLFSMPFASEQFDCIVDYNASYHTDTAGYQRAVSEIRRVLRPGGEVFLTLLSRRDTAYQAAGPADKLDRFTVKHAGSAPHFYAGREDLEEIFQGFRFVIPPREVIAPGLDNPKESVHFQLLLKKL